MNWRPTGTFEVSSGWNTDFKLPFDPDDVEKKNRYGTELAKINAQNHEHYFQAAQVIFPDSVGSASWIAQHWSRDPVVIAAREAYKPPPKPLLDKDALAAKLLECADEKIVRNGQNIYINEAKDRLGFYKLYAEVMEFTGKATSTNINNFPSNEMKIVLVKPDEKAEIKTIEPIKKVQQEITSVTPLRIKAV